MNHKPRIKSFRGSLWFCAIPLPFICSCFGIGRTPKEAWEIWHKLYKSNMKSE